MSGDKTQPLDLALAERAWAKYTEPKLSFLDGEAAYAVLKEEIPKAFAELRALRSPRPSPAALREKLAALAHEQWSGWMKYLFSKCEILPNGDLGELAVIPEWAVQRWKRQMETAYADLSEQEKNSDREEADRVLALLAAPVSPAPSLVSPPPDLREAIARQMYKDFCIGSLDAEPAWFKIQFFERVDRVLALLAAGRGGMAKEGGV